MISPHPHSWLLACLLVNTLTSYLPAATPASDASCTACDREMRKTFEAIQAWRRSHQGRYPNRLEDLKVAGLLPATGGICPTVLAEHSGAEASHNLATSRGANGDPEGTYEYELSTRLVAGPGPRQFTRLELKSELLRRAHWEQVPILRCSSHRNPASAGGGEPKSWRNLTATGNVYWSGRYWETNWLNDVPYCCRDLNVMYGLKGPPFHSGRAPTLPGALDLRTWSCAFGDHPWWWTYPFFGEGDSAPATPHLRPFFAEQHGRIAVIQGETWWVDGLVQLQGKISSDPSDAYRAPSRQTFVWNKQNVAVERLVDGATWLQGTVWTANPGDVTGWLAWNYSDGHVERVPIVYGESTARFWADARQLRMETNILSPAWQHYEKLDGGKGGERWLRLYQQKWVNPRPAIKVTSLDFISNPDCPAAPFLVAVNVMPH